MVTGLSDPTKNTIELPGAILTLFEKRVQGSLFGSGDPFHDIPRMVELYQSGDLKLDELITKHVHARPGQPGLPGSARRQEHPRRHRLRH